MAVWAHESPAKVGADLACALRAVCEMDRTTGTLSRNLSLPTPLRVGAGINTGPAILGGADYTALGDTVNSAFRLEAATKTLGFNIAIGEGAFQALCPLPTPPFQRCEVQLKGYESLSTAWAISFEELRCYLASNAG